MKQDLIYIVAIRLAGDKIEIFRFKTDGERRAFIKACELMGHNDWATSELKLPAKKQKDPSRPNDE